MSFHLLRSFLAAALIGLAIGGTIDARAQPAPQAQHAESPSPDSAQYTEHNKVAKSVREMLAAILDKTWDDPVAFYTFVVAIFTGVLGISTIGLWIVTAKGIRNQARDTEILERAYLAVEPGGIWEHADRGDRVTVKFTVRNVGHLPARDVVWSSAGATPDLRGTIDFTLTEPSGDGIVIAPGTATTLHGAVVFIWGENGPCLGNTMHLWGIVQYRDGFGKKRHTRFHHYYGTKHLTRGQAFSLPSSAGELAENGNDAN
jgi:hypothetical protein